MSLERYQGHAYAVKDRAMVEVSIDQTRSSAGTAIMVSEAARRFQHAHAAGAAEK